MNLSPRWADALRDAGVESAHWSQLGDPSAPDADIAAFALTEGWLVLTRDLNFGKALILGRSSLPSVIQMRAKQMVIEHALPQVISALSLCRDELVAGALVTIDTSAHRMRVLPLPRGWPGD